MNKFVISDFTIPVVIKLFAQYIIQSYNYNIIQGYLSQTQNTKDKTQSKQMANESSTTVITQI